MTTTEYATAAVISLDAEKYKDALELASHCTFEEIASALEKTGRSYRACQELASYLKHPVTDHRA